LYLKSLTVRGFKSFASATTLHFERGITCIVGPNGSGKSNVVDALAWVMGEQGAKSLRGGKMEDVIFSGTAGRPPLGRAEVVLTIDNTDGALPVDYTEVTLRRTMFRSGSSEYAMNGSPCRLLDVQELLADSGIGREMHVIVGQGQLDAILHATPEERRGFIEEAAGVLKHRKRKEKALRKLDATDTNLTRLSDLIAEIRRQLKPLGRQAEVAQRASAVQIEVRDARARLLAHDAVHLADQLEQELSAEREVHERRAEVESQLSDVRREEQECESELLAGAPRLTRAQETWFGLQSVRERLRGTATLAKERLRNLAEDDQMATPSRNLDELEAQAAALRQQEDVFSADVAERRVQLAAAVTARQQAEAAAAAEERRIATALRAAADRREGRATLVGQVNALRSLCAAATDEIRRLTEAREHALARAARAQAGFTALETRIAGLDSGERGLDAEYEGATALLSDLDDRLAKHQIEAQDAERERAALKARAEALESSLHRRDASAALVAARTELAGVLGAVAEALSVRHGCEAAVAAALGWAADALTVDGLPAAVEAVAYLKAGDLGRAGLVVASAHDEPEEWPALPSFATYAVDVVTAPAELSSAVRRLLDRTAIVPDLAAASRLVSDRPDVVAVTAAGDRVASHLVVGGSSSEPSRLETQAAVEQAAAALAEVTGRCERLRFAHNTLEAEREEAASRVAVALAKLHESDAVLAAVAEELSQLGSLARSAKEEADRIASAIATAEESRERDAAGLADLEKRLPADGSEGEIDPDISERDRLAEVARTLRQAETDARLRLRTAEERVRALEGQAGALERAASEERAARIRAADRRRRREREGREAEAVAGICDIVLPRLDQTLAEAAKRRADLEARKGRGEARLVAARQRVRMLEAEFASLTDSAHRDEMLRAEYRLRREQLELTSREELGLDLDDLVAGYGPDQPVPAAAEPHTVPFVRAEQEKRLRRAERDLAELGRINPLALEEFSALEERHRFLSEQLEDLKRTRHDLLDIVKEVDARVEAVFAAAYDDVAREFAVVFDRLFPGGEGSLVLTEPSDLLETGVDVEARPAGKRVKRLSLLSGGERSLVAVAFLVALFKARPSPFYILDEVEAALDDTNLSRLLHIYEELREASQLLVITHQKRTMSIADALYGVSMRGDGVSTVISQRLREPAPA
jgi:chromosome segregation protein